jgi:hypothetical protein
MTKSSPKRCPNGSRRVKGICKKVIRGGDGDDDDYDEEMFANNPFNPQRKSPSKAKAKKSEPLVSAARGVVEIAAKLPEVVVDGAIKKVSKIAKDVVKVASVPLEEIARVAEIGIGAAKKKSPFLKRNLKKALELEKKRTRAKKPLIYFGGDSDSESVGSSDSEDSYSSDESNLSDFIDYEDDVPDDSGYRKKLDKFKASKGKHYLLH